MANAHAYCREAMNDTIPNLEKQKGIALGIYEEKIRRHGYNWGCWFEDQPETYQTALLHRPVGFAMLKALAEWDYVIFPAFGASFISIEDMARTVTLLVDRKVGCIIPDLKLDTRQPHVQALVEGMALATAITRRGVYIGMIDGIPRQTFANWRKPDEERMILAEHIVQWREANWTWAAIYWHLIKIKMKNRFTKKEYGMDSIKRLYKVGIEARAKGQTRDMQDGEELTDQLQDATSYDSEVADGKPTEGQP